MAFTNTKNILVNYFIPQAAALMNFEATVCNNIVNNVLLDISHKYHTTATHTVKFNPPSCAGARDSPRSVPNMLRGT